MKKRILSLLLAVLMIVSILPMGAFADVTYVAQIIGSDNEVVGEYTDLLTACNAVQNGQTLNLLAKSFDADDRAAVSKLNGKTVTVKGQGMEETSLNVTLNGHVTGSSTITFKDLTITFTQNGTQQYLSLSANYENVKINGSVTTVYGKNTFTNCIFTGTTNEYALWQYGGTLELNGCEFEGGGTKGCIKNYGESGNALNCIVSDTKFDVVPKNGVIYCTNQNNQAGNSSNANSNGNAVYCLTLSGITLPEGKELDSAIMFKEKQGVTLINPTFDENNKVISATLQGGCNDDMIKNVVATVMSPESNLAKGEDGTYSIKEPAFKQNADKEWVIDCAEALEEFSAKVNGGKTFSGETVKLTADIDMKDVANFTPIGSTEKTSFQGTFDGCGHTISNLTSNVGLAYGGGFFSNIIGPATVKNLTLDNVNIASTLTNAQGRIKGNVYGVVAGYAYGSVSFEDITVKNSSVKAYGKVGAILGMAADPNGTTVFKNCTVENTKVQGTYDCATLCGTLQNDIVIENCKGIATWVPNSLDNDGNWDKYDAVDGYRGIYAIDAATPYYCVAWAEAYTVLKADDGRLGSEIAYNYVAKVNGASFVSVASALSASKKAGDKLELIEVNAANVAEIKAFEVDGCKFVDNKDNTYTLTNCTVSYEWASDNSKCTAKRACGGAVVDQQTVDSSNETTKTATCKLQGEITYTADFTKAWATVQTKKVATPIDKNNHVHIDNVAAKKATCTEIGWDAYTKCTDCGAKFNYKQIPALGHINNNGVCERCGNKLAVVTITGAEGFEVKHTDIVTLTVKTTNMPTGAHYVWTALGGDVQLRPTDASGKSCEVMFKHDGKVVITVTAVDSLGRPITNDGELVNASTTINVVKGYNSIFDSFMPFFLALFEGIRNFFLSLIGR